MTVYRSDNKALGTSFEKEFCAVLAEKGFWVHFCTPAPNGSQPCDVIAVKDGNAYLIDCKTCKDKRFRFSRLEDNQVYAFRKWGRCGNLNRYVAVKHEDNIYLIPFEIVEEKQTVELKDEYLFR